MTRPKQKKPGNVALFASADLRPAAAWLPALFGLLVICCESTRVMGADHTMVWLTRLCSPVMNTARPNMVELNHILRKSGHFFGYGMLGLVFLQGWLPLLRRRIHRTWTRLRLLAGGLATLSVAMVASMDEIHQSFLPNRTACVSDVLLDTTGAVLLILFVSVMLMVRRKRTLNHLLTLRSTRQRPASMWLFRNSFIEHANESPHPLTSA